MSCSVTSRQARMRSCRVGIGKSGRTPELELPLALGEVVDDGDAVPGLREGHRGRPAEIAVAAEDQDPLRSRCHLRFWEHGDGHPRPRSSLASGARSVRSGQGPALIWATLDLMEPGAEPVAEIGPSGRPLSSSLARLTLVGIVLLAAGLRLAGIDFGRPYVYHPDEGFIAQPAMNIVRTERSRSPPRTSIPQVSCMPKRRSSQCSIHSRAASIDTARIQPIERMSRPWAK